jgi:pyrroline-5-carboxylate reductase
MGEGIMGKIKQRIGFIGCGNMGSAIVKGILESDCLQNGGTQIFVYDISTGAREAMKALGVQVMENNEQVAEAADLIFLAVKPQFMGETLASTGHALKDKCVISITAGLSADTIRGMIPVSARVLRTMPNTPALVRLGAFALCSDCDLTEEEKQVADDIFSRLGTALWVPERLIDAVCGVSGSGPAYVAMFIEAMADGGVREGLPRKTAYQLAAQTVLGTAQMYLELGLHPAELKDMVTSPAGTTIEGCYALEKNGFRGAVMDAVHEGAERSRNLNR